MPDNEDEIARRVAAMTTDELIAELLYNGDPKMVRAALEEVLFDAGLTSAEVRRLLEAAQKRKGPVKH
jgi:hypothetical protein